MELVYQHPEGRPYGGRDVGFEGERYEVQMLGSRQMIYVPGSARVKELEQHHWFSTGVANQRMIEQAANSAMAQNAKEAAMVHEAMVTSGHKFGLLDDELVTMIPRQGVRLTDDGQVIGTDEAMYKFKVARPKLFSTPLGAQTLAPENDPPDGQTASGGDNGAGGGDLGIGGDAGDGSADGGKAGKGGRGKKND